MIVNKYMKINSIPNNMSEEENQPPNYVCLSE